MLNSRVLRISEFAPVGLENDSGSSDAATNPPIPRSKPRLVIPEPIIACPLPKFEGRHATGGRTPNRFSR